MIEAINEALEVAMLERDPDVMVLRRGCRLFRRRLPRDCGLQAKHGKTTRVSIRRSPRCGIIGVAVGMGVLTACARCPKSSSPTTSIPARPARQRGGTVALSLGGRVHRADHRARARSAAASSAGRRIRSRPEAIFAHISGHEDRECLRTPYDAKGLLIAAIEDNDPVIFLRAQADLQRAVRRAL